jgi:DNA-binding NtrC family response regulator
MDHDVLFVSPHIADASALSRMLLPVSVRVEHATTFRDARTMLPRGEHSVVLTERHLPDGSWADILRTVQDMALPCLVMVTDRLADDRFWAEVLNLGAYDLLAQPFDASEVQRIVTSACMHAHRKPAASAFLTEKALGFGTF